MVWITNFQNENLNINLAGMNIDIELFQELKKQKALGKLNLEDLLKKATPETISAAAARISRNPAPINQLRVGSFYDVEKARKSNWTIVFNLGHSSVAEHAFFNLDIINVTRLATEELQLRRLTSYTEKSQRYVTFDKSYYTPREIRFTKLGNEYNQLMDQLFDSYQQFSSIIKKMLISKGKKQQDAELIAKEDARYLLPLSTFTQFELSGNARTLEYHISRLKSSKRSEVNMIGEGMHNILSSVAPSLFSYGKIDPFFTKGEEQLQSTVNSLIINKTGSKTGNKIYHKLNSDDSTLAALIVSRSDLNFNQAHSIIKKSSYEEKMNLHLAANKYANNFNSPRREYEFENKVHDLILSATAYAQFKRHRTCTQVTQPYNARLGVTIPQTVIDAGLKDKYMAITKKATNFFMKLQKSGLKNIAPYTLTNGHNRRVLFYANKKELHKFSFERNNPHAQWDINNVVKEIIFEEKKLAPITMSLACGKHIIIETYNNAKEVLYVHSN